MKTPYCLILLLALLPFGCQKASTTDAQVESSGDPDPVLEQGGEDESCCTEVAPAAVAPLPDTSIYQLESTWLDQSGQETSLADGRGTVTMVAMIFTNCSYACPRIMADLAGIEAGLSPDELARVNWLLVSMDHERDLPEVLAAYAQKHELDTERWTLLHGDAGAVREIAATLGVRYKKNPGGDYAHSNLISVLDADGVIHEQLEGLGIEASKGVAAIQSALAQKP